MLIKKEKFIHVCQVITIAGKQVEPLFVKPDPAKEKSYWVIFADISSCMSGKISRKNSRTIVSE
jgi:hypothetical protein